MKKSQQSAIPQTRPQVEVKPVTLTQRRYLTEIRKNDITFGIGPAGTGKTFLAAKMAMLYFTEGWVDKIVICRPAVNAGGEDIGFLPGSITQKMDPYIKPITDTFMTYWSKKTITDLIGNGMIEISPLAYMRGRTFTDTFIVADEMQNATSDQLLMLLTRLGEGSKMIVTGDPVQSDLRGKSCFDTAYQVLGGLDSLGFVNFTKTDVVRHKTVKQILDAWMNLSMNGANTAITAPAM